MTQAAEDGWRGGRSKTGAQGERQGGVQSIMRALAILDELAGNDDGLSLTALSRSVGLPPSSAHRLLTTLQRNRFVRFEQSSMTWRVGVQAFIVGAAFARSREITAIAMPFMRQLMEKSGETVNLYVPSSGQAVCIAQVQSRQMISVISRPGGALPLGRSAAGKAMLASLPRREIDENLAKHALRGEKRSAAEKRKLHAELASVRSQRYALDDEKVAPGLRCVAAAILDENGMAHAAMSIAGPTIRLTDHRLPRLAELVVAAGEAVTEAFGGFDGARSSERRRIKTA
jgi:IclR family acetate operon transcriptional repressor